ncbi:CARDB domain-containing protein, partial [Umezakia ovalisporum]
MVTSASNQPNLVISSLTIPTEVTWGETYEVSWTVTNQGETATTTSQWYDEVYFSLNDQLNNDFYLGRYEYEGGVLAPGDSYTGSVVITVPSGLFSGTGYTFVVANNNNDGELETDRQDNLAVQAVQINASDSLGDLNEPPTAVTVNNTTTSIAENTDTTNRIKLADIIITDDGLGDNQISLTSDDADSFEIEGTELYLKAGTILDFETKTSYSITINVDDNTVGETPDITTEFSLIVEQIPDEPYIVADINQTSVSSNPGNFINIGGVLYFTANDDINGTKLWKAHPTTGEVTLLETNPEGGSNFGNFININGDFYFTASSPTTGTELWKI